MTSLNEQQVYGSQDGASEPVFLREASDIDLIKATITHQSVYCHVSDDTSPDPSEYAPVPCDYATYLAAFVGNQYAGMFMLHMQNGATIEVHTCLLPNARGKAKKLAKELIEWVWSNTNAQRLVTCVPEYNRLAMKLALDSGMKEYGLNPCGFIKNGKFHDVHLLGITRGAKCQ